jgi:leader peptidase (prepilin peptidase)/N-methyltransferase
VIIEQIVPGIDSAPRIAVTASLAIGGAAAMAWRFGWSAPLAAYVFFAAASVVVSVTDMVAQHIPNPVVFLACLVGPALLAVASARSDTWGSLIRAAIAAGALAGFYLLLGLGFPAGVGFGDVKWAGVTGLYLGWLDWSAVSTGTVVAFLAAAVFVAARRLASCRGRQLVVPMAPFMTAGSLVAILTTR